ncbi:hypothetical protein ACEQ8H_004153 [Pleosporales sp. CAS-2024a]
MDRSLGNREGDKSRVTRDNSFQGQKRKISTTKNNTSGTSTASQTDNMSSFKTEKPPNAASDLPLIVRFYDEEIRARDSRGRTQEEMLAWPDSQLEDCHNYIQMLFPVPEGSAFNWEAPIIDRETMDAFRSRTDLRDRMRHSFERMLTFYGFAVQMPSKKKKDDISHVEDTETKQIIRGANFAKNSRNWAVRFDHNHLRITRILRCLRVLGLQVECDAFFKALQDVYDDAAFKISPRSLMYWTHAVTRPLYIAPNDDQIGWLKEWEEEQVQET